MGEKERVESERANHLMMGLQMLYGGSEDGSDDRDWITQSQTLCAKSSAQTGTGNNNSYHLKGAFSRVGTNITTQNYGPGSLASGVSTVTGGAAASTGVQNQKSKSHTRTGGLNLSKKEKSRVKKREKKLKKSKKAAHWHGNIGHGTN